MIYHEMSSISEKKSKISVEIKCNIEGDLSSLFLIFSTDNAHSWYSVKMKNQESGYSITLPNVPFGNKILYLFKIIGSNGEEFVEDNNGQYFFEIAGQKIVENEKLDQKQEISTSSKNSFISPNKITLEESIIENVVNDLIENNETIFIEKPRNNLEKPIEKIDSKTVLISQNDTGISAETNELNSQIEIPDENVDGNSSLGSQANIRPIIPYNPFSADYGDIESSQSALLSFSQIIDGRMTSPPQKRNSYIKKVQVVNISRSCMKCKANLNSKWKICPICGSKN